MEQSDKKNLFFELIKSDCGDDHLIAAELYDLSFLPVQYNGGPRRLLSDHLGDWVYAGLVQAAKDIIYKKTYNEKL